jgi:hypothetical protein
MLSHLAQQFNVPIINVVGGLAALGVFVSALAFAAIYALIRPRHRRHRRSR